MSTSAPAKPSFANVAAASASSSSSTTPASGGLLTAQEEQEESAKIVQHYKGLRAQISETANKINELDSDRNEHQLVLRALAPLDPNRRCYRSIGGVLVERTIKEVQPAVEKNLKGVRQPTTRSHARPDIEDVIGKLSSDLKALEAAADEFRIKHNIKMGDAPAQGGQEDGQERKSGGGVLA